MTRLMCTFWTEWTSYHSTQCNHLSELVGILILRCLIQLCTTILDCIFAILYILPQILMTNWTRLIYVKTAHWAARMTCSTRPTHQTAAEKAAAKHGDVARRLPANSFWSWRRNSTAKNTWRSANDRRSPAFYNSARCRSRSGFRIAERNGSDWRPGSQVGGPGWIRLIRNWWCPYRCMWTDLRYGRSNSVGQDYLNRTHRVQCLRLADKLDSIRVCLWHRWRNNTTTTTLY